MEGAAQIDGDALVHIDVRSDNLCFSGDRVVLVDWNLVARANPLLDVAAWLPSLHSEGGPLPEDIETAPPNIASEVYSSISFEVRSRGRSEASGCPRSASPLPARPGHHLLREALHDALDSRHIVGAHHEGYLAHSGVGVRVDSTQQVVRTALHGSTLLGAG